jgi:protein SCO1/2
MVSGRWKRRGREAACVSALLLACAVVAGCSDRTSVYEARGVAREIHREYRQVVVEHEDIPGLMPAMTMNFDVADPSLLDRLVPGQVIRFRLEASRKGYRIREATVLDEKSLAGTGGARLEALAAEAEPAPRFRLRNQDGRSVGLDDLAGKVVVLDFIYTRCPGPCPILTGVQVDLQRLLPAALRERTWFVSITLDPEYDTPEQMRAYAQARGADLANWWFLTGPREQVEEVIQSYGVGKLPGPDGTVDHLVITFVIDPQGRIARRFVGFDHEPPDLLRELQRVAG